jgi:hypothetical protein
MKARRTIKSYVMKHFYLAILLGLGLLSPVEVSASVAVRLDLSQLVDRADYIVMATGIDQSTRWDRYKGIVSDTTMKVNESLKGSFNKNQTIVVTTLGGTIDNLAMIVPGEASIAVGRPVLVFLRRAKYSDELHVVGMSQGIFSIDQTSARPVVLPSETSGIVDPLDDSVSSGEVKTAIAQPTTVDKVVSKVRALVASSLERGNK